MSISILSGICRGGPWDGDRYTQTTLPVRAGCFNLIGLAGVRGSYSIGIEPVHGNVPNPISVWRWGPWIEEPEKTGCGWTEDPFTTRPDRDPSRP